jgi:sulfur-oxidizing protein SoxX
MNRSTGAALALLAAALLGGCATTPVPQAKKGYADWPCLSYNLPCAKLATRKPVQKALEGPLNGDAERGQKLAFERARGNCLACHVMRGGTQPGTRGPDLSRYGALGRSDAETYTLVYDMRTRVPNTLMPPIGTNAILTDQEIRDVVAFLQASK